MGRKAPPAPGRSLYLALEAAPWGNELIQLCALRALESEKLGAGDRIDLLAVSYSSNDYVGHRYGPDSPETRDMAIRVDRLIGDLIRAAEAQAGAGRVLAVLTADHGVPPLPEVNLERGMPGGRLNMQQARAAVEKNLTARFGEGKWIADFVEGVLYLNREGAPGKSVDRAELERVAADALRAQPHVFRVYTRTQLSSGALPADLVGMRVRNSFNEVRSGDVFAVPDPYWMAIGSGTNHGSPFGYDTHVPVIFYGSQIRAGSYHFNIAINDIAPTLATLLGIETPSGSTGRTLHEILK
jgi:arylsulfatase A-like enzyme